MSEFRMFFVLVMAKGDLDELMDILSIADPLSSELWLDRHYLGTEEKQQYVKEVMVEITITKQVKQPLKALFDIDLSHTVWRQRDVQQHPRGHVVVTF